MILELNIGTNNMKTIMMCIPHNYPTFDTAFVLSLLSLQDTFYKKENELKYNYGLGLARQSAPDIEVMRNFLVRTVLGNKADYALWLDTDMTFPPDMITKMLKHFEDDEKLEAVTGLYTWKVPPFIPHVYEKLNERGKFDVGCSFPLNEPFKVEGAGFGCIMIKSTVLDRLEHPYFKMYKDEEKVGYGEDFHFCKNAKMNMICDPSIVCNHFNTNEFNINHYIAANGLKVEDNRIVVTEEQKEIITKKFVERKL